MVSPGCSTIRSQIRKYSSSVVTDFKFASLKEFTVETQQTTSTIHQTQRYFNGTSNTTNYINCTSNTTVHQTQQTTSTVHQTQLTRIHGPAPSDRISAFQLQRHFPKNQNGQRSMYRVYLWIRSERILEEQTKPHPCNGFKTVKEMSLVLCHVQ